MKSKQILVLLALTSAMLISCQKKSNTSSVNAENKTDVVPGVSVDVASVHTQEIGISGVSTAPSTSAAPIAQPDTPPKIQAETQSLPTSVAPAVQNDVQPAVANSQVISVIKVQNQQKNENDNSDLSTIINSKQCTQLAGNPILPNAVLYTSIKPKFKTQYLDFLKVSDCNSVYNINIPKTNNSKEIRLFLSSKQSINVQLNVSGRTFNSQFIDHLLISENIFNINIGSSIRDVTLPVDTVDKLLTDFKYSKIDENTIGIYDILGAKIASYHIDHMKEYRLYYLHEKLHNHNIVIRKIKNNQNICIGDKLLDATEANPSFLRNSCQ